MNLVSPSRVAVYGATYVAYLFGLIYWYFWLYRIHKILGEVSPAYPITPKKAVGFRLIPFYNLIYWNFRWTNQIADFVRQRSNSISMPKGWVGVWLIVASLLSVFGHGLKLIALFAISGYLTSKIRRSLSLGLTTFAAPPATAEPLHFGAPVAVTTPAFEHFAVAAPAMAIRPAASPWNFDLTKQWGVPVSAGVGAAFGFLMCYGIWLNVPEFKTDLITFLLNLLVVALVLYFFLEPLVEKLLEAFGAATHHVSHKVWHRLFRFLVLMIIVDVGHSFLEQVTARSSGRLALARFGILFTVFFGGTTLLWIVSSARTKFTESLAIITAGTVVLVGLSFIVLPSSDAVIASVAEKQRKELGNELGNGFEATRNILDPNAGNLSEKVKQAANASWKLSEVSTTDELAKGATHSKSPAKKEGGLGVLCAVSVVLAGFIAMRKTFKPLIVAGSVFATAVLVGAIFGWVSSPEQKFHVVTGLWAAYWWCMGMLVLHDEEGLSRIALALPKPPSEGGGSEGSEFPRSVWVVSGLVLIGLIGAALLFRPQGDEIGARVLRLQADGKRAYGAPNPRLHYSSPDLTDDELKSKLDGTPIAYIGASVESPVSTYPIFLTLGNSKVKVKDNRYHLRLLQGFLTIYPAQSRVSLSSNSSDAAVNSPVTLTASVASTEGSGTPGGNVTFYSDAAELATQALANGTADLVVNKLPSGTHIITAKYSGDTNFTSSDSQPLTQSVHEAEPRRVDVNHIVIPKGTLIDIQTRTTIDSNSSKEKVALMASLLGSPNRFLKTQVGAVAILSLGNIDREGYNGARPSVSIYLQQLWLAGQNHEIDATLLMQGAPQGRAGHVFIPAGTRLTFQLESPLKVDLSPASSPRKTGH